MDALTTYMEEQDPHLVPRSIIPHHLGPCSSATRGGTLTPLASLIPQPVPTVGPGPRCRHTRGSPRVSPSLHLPAPRSPVCSLQGTSVSLRTLTSLNRHPQFSSLPPHVKACHIHPQYTGSRSATTLNRTEAPQGDPALSIKQHVITANPTLGAKPAEHSGLLDQRPALAQQQQCDSLAQTAWVTV